MRRYETGLRTRRRILDATRDVLAEGGLEGTTLKSICERADVGSGSFYNLFSSKEEAILAVIREAIAASDPAVDSSSETVTDLIDAYLGFLTTQAAMARIYLQAATSWGLNDPDLAHRFRRHQERRRDRLAAALEREDDARSAAACEREAEYLLACLNGLAVTWLLDPSIDLDAHRVRLLRDQ